MKLRVFGLAIGLFVSCAAPVGAETLLIASASGYRKPLMELIQKFPASSDIKVEASFGHMKQIETQARQNPDIALLVGDRAFLEPMKLADRYERLGSGKLALIYSKTIKLTSVQDLGSDKVQRFATPDQKRAIYGNAAMQCLQRTGLIDKVGGKMVENDTVPQVGSYVALGEMDAGFVNLTEALGQGDRIGGYVQAPADCYDPIDISMAVMKNHEGDKAVKAWIDFVSSAPAREILSHYGLD
ncbi:molybdate ABC transporter substrate-binding protein [Allopusillimonas ginsengisoli]|uniref:molybdate ABC transporter substrate-binding protein n=1 Tax=Allopusillimonas ginsengisoli TaxID=453575 RepID=UPI0010221647|nr:molybdate ABC transporter substrate-binding protein [Allopusillimonas ginsengisoli]TEA79917.1 molybdate ABC transporter substrate-binding protein [Allopusillimonas ginsengisoli]